MNIIIKNCNNIDNGDIIIQEGRLNIKYAINGTGKTTISRAIEACGSENLLRELVPYKYLNENPIEEEHSPSVLPSKEINKISIFNEEYINKYVFLPTDLLDNSFEILVKTDDYETRMGEIYSLLHEIQDAFENNPEIIELSTELTKFIEGFGKAKNGYSKTGSIGKGIAKGNKITHIPEILSGYTPYIQHENNVSWLTWQSKGITYLDITDKCPYCAGELDFTKKETVRQVAVEYDAKYVTELQKMIDVFMALEDFLTDEAKSVVYELRNKGTELNDEEINFLKEVKEQVKVLNDKLIDIRFMNFNKLKDVDRVVDALQSKRINITLLGHINSEHTNSKVTIVNNALDAILEKAGRLQGAIALQRDHIKSTIDNYSKEINGFLESAGYKYKISTEQLDDEGYKLSLISTENEVVIEGVKTHLSYGERNAFALVLFMYQAIKENPDLIILDDPISSFDINKKYAIMEKLFQGTGSLRGRTVVMLTHDFDPIVDLIHTASIRSRFYPVPVASFLENKNGELIEKEITPTDVKSFYEISSEKTHDENLNEINRLIYLRRKMEACGEKGLAWELLSNIFHPGREEPILQSEDNRKMTPDEIREATELIQMEIPTFEYNRIYSNSHDITHMIELYHSTTAGYEKIQLYRMINHGNIHDTIFKKFVDETYHVENDNLFQLNPSDFPTIPEYIVDLCDKQIALLADSLEE